jgi:hypothetical protein
MIYAKCLTGVIGALCLLTGTSFAQSSASKRDYLKVESSPLNFLCGASRVKCDDAGYKPIYLNGAIYLKDEKKEVFSDGARLLFQSNTKSLFFDNELFLSSEFVGVHSAVSAGNRLADTYFVLSNSSRLAGKFDPELHLLRNKNLLNALSVAGRYPKSSVTFPQGSPKISGGSISCTFPAQREVSITSFKEFAEVVNSRDVATQAAYRCITNISQLPTQTTTAYNAENLPLNTTKSSVINTSAIREKIYDIISREIGDTKIVNIADALLIENGLLIAIDEYESSNIKKPLAVAFVWIPISIVANDSIELNSKNGVFVDFSNFIEQAFDSPVQVSALSLDAKSPDILKFAIKVKKQGDSTSFYTTPLTKITEQHNSKKFELMIGSILDGHRTLIFPGIVSRFVPNGSEGWLLLSSTVDSANIGMSKYFSMKRDTYVELSMPTRK